MGLVDQLFAFAALERSPDPQQLVNEAVAQIEKHPLSSIFGTSYFDREGKVVYRSEGGGFGDRDNDPAVRQQIAQAESIRRQIAVGGKIEIARQHIASHQYISDDALASILHHSPFVPEDVILTFARGFTRL